MHEIVRLCHKTSRSSYHWDGDGGKMKIPSNQIPYCAQGMYVLVVHCVFHCLFVN